MSKKITQLEELSLPAIEDLLEIVDDPSGVPTSKKVTTANLLRTLIDPWLALPTCTYISATSFSLSGDWSSLLKIGAKFKCTNSSVKYGYVLNSSYSSGTGLTTVNLVANTSYSLAAGSISGAYISYANPPDFPLLSWSPTPTFSGGTTDPTSFAFTTPVFSIHAGECTVNFGGTLTRGSGDRTTIILPLPVNYVGANSFQVTITFRGSLVVPNYGQSGTHQYLLVGGMTSDGYMMASGTYRIM